MPEEPGYVDDVFSASPAVQRKILAILLKGRYATTLANIFQPSFFEGHVFVDIAKIGIDYIREYKSPPTKEIMVYSLGDLLMQRKASDEIIESYSENLTKIYRMKLPDEEAFMDKAIKFAKHRALVNAVVAGYKDLMKGNQKTVMPLIEEAWNVGNRIDLHEVPDYFETFDERLKEYEQWDKLVVSKKVPTPWPAINKVLDGGFTPGENFFIFGASGGGKTSLACAIAAHAAAYCGIPTIYFSFELSARQIERKIDRFLLKMSKDDLRTKPERARLEIERLHQKIEKTRKRLWIEYKQPGVYTMDEILARCEYIERELGIAFVLFIIDYPDLTKIRPSVKYPGREDLELADIFVRGMGWGRTNEKVMGYLSQYDREGAVKLVPTQANVPGTIEKFNNTDRAFFFTQTVEQVRDKLGCLRIGKNREGEGSGFVEIAADWAYMDVHQISGDLEYGHK